MRDDKFIDWKVTFPRLGLWMLLILFGVTTLLGQEKKAPTFTVDQQRDFFKAQSQLNIAELALERSDLYKLKDQRTEEFQKVLNALGVVCGAQYQLALSPTGDPECQLKPPEPKPQVPKRVEQPPSEVKPPLPDPKKKR